MKRLAFLAILGIGFCFTWTLRADKHADAKDGHVVLTPDKLQWKSNPILPAGAESVLLSGDPTKEGSLFAIRIKVPDGFKIPPHWHPSDENVTVLQGTLLIGVGEQFDPSKLESVPTGGFMRMPKEMRHFGKAKGELIVQVHGVGPFAINYVNPADDPRKK
jgi:quercetin dioxygenase-like cupin family protein